jgi:hypothetical protein
MDGSPYLRGRLSSLRSVVDGVPLRSRRRSARIVSVSALRGHQGIRLLRKLLPRRRLGFEGSQRPLAVEGRHVAGYSERRLALAEDPALEHPLQHVVHNLETHLPRDDLVHLCLQRVDGVLSPHELPVVVQMVHVDVVCACDL